MAPEESFFEWIGMIEQALQNKPDYYRLKFKEVYTRLGSKPEGLSSAEALERLKNMAGTKSARLKGSP